MASGIIRLWKKGKSALVSVLFSFHFSPESIRVSQAGLQEALHCILYSV